MCDLVIQGQADHKNLRLVLMVISGIQAATTQNVSAGHAKKKMLCTSPMQFLNLTHLCHGTSCWYEVEDLIVHSPVWHSCHIHIFISFLNIVFRVC